MCMSKIEGERRGGERRGGERREMVSCLPLYLAKYIKQKFTRN